MTGPAARVPATATWLRLELAIAIFALGFLIAFGLVVRRPSTAHAPREADRVLASPAQR